MDSTGRNRAGKRPIPYQAIIALMESLRPEVDLSKRRLETVCLIVVGMVSARSLRTAVQNSATVAAG